MLGSVQYSQITLVLLKSDSWKVNEWLPNSSEDHVGKARAGHLHQGVLIRTENLGLSTTKLIQSSLQDKLAFQPDEAWLCGWGLLPCCLCWSVTAMPPVPISYPPLVSELARVCAGLLWGSGPLSREDYGSATAFLWSLQGWYHLCYWSSRQDVQRMALKHRCPEQFVRGSGVLQLAYNRTQEPISKFSGISQAIC